MHQHSSRPADPGPVAQERARFEADALREQARHAPAHVPAVHRFDAQLALIVMEFLPPPAVIARGLLNAGAVLPALPQHVASFMAATLFHTSLFALDSTSWRCVHRTCCACACCAGRSQVAGAGPVAAGVQAHA